MTRPEASVGLRVVEAASAALALLLSVTTGAWLLATSGGDVYLGIFTAELVAPAVIVALGACLHAGGGYRWGRYLLWLGALLAVLETPALLWMLPFAVSLGLMVVSGLSAIWSVRRATEAA